MTATYDLIASNVLTSPASSVTFSGISGSYRDLVLVAEVRGNTSVVEPFARFNSDTGGNYNGVRAFGNGTSAVSTSYANNTYLEISVGNATTTQSRLSVLQIMDYSATDKHKSVLVRTDRAGETTEMVAARWASTSAINAIQVYVTSNAFASGSTFYLYGIVS